MNVDNAAGTQAQSFNVVTQVEPLTVDQRAALDNVSRLADQMADPSLSAAEQRKAGLLLSAAIGVADALGVDIPADAEAFVRGFRMEHQDTFIHADVQTEMFDAHPVATEAPVAETVETSGGAEATDAPEPRIYDPKKMDEIITDGEALTEFYETDPEGFAKGWRKLDSKDRSLALHTLQEHSAVESQLTQMITNIMKSLHDTTMSIARNLAV